MKTIKLGDRVTVERLLDLGGDVWIEAGEQGTVDYIDTRTGSAEILMDTYHQCLSLWRNHLWTDDYILSALSFAAAFQSTIAS
jgi:hypothetical protein